jgi:hypothetical protein
MPPCEKCRSGVFLDTTLCKEHYYELYNIEPEFHKYKEKQWRDFITYHMLSSWDILPIYNRQLPNSSVIPDLHFVLRLKGESILFMIEIDEYQHGQGLNYTPGREELRYSQLAAYDRVHVFRVNPDSTTKEKNSIFEKKTHILSPGVLKQVIHTNQDEFQKRKTLVSRKLDEVLRGEILLKRSSTTPIMTWFLGWLWWLYEFIFSPRTHVTVYKMFYD